MKFKSIQNSGDQIQFSSIPFTDEVKTFLSSPAAIAFSLALSTPKKRECFGKWSIQGLDLHSSLGLHLSLHRERAVPEPHGQNG